jgi:hypothetical protein
MVINLFIRLINLFYLNKNKKNLLICRIINKFIVQVNDSHIYKLMDLKYFLQIFLRLKFLMGGVDGKNQKK